MFTDFPSQPLQRFFLFLFLVLCSFLFIPAFSASAGPIDMGVSAIGSYLEAEDLTPEPVPQGVLDCLRQSTLQLSEISEDFLSQQYLLAKEFLFTRHFWKARSLFQELGSYADSQELAEFCRSYPASESQSDSIMIQSNAIVNTFSDGTLYTHPRGLFYIPDHVSSSTSFVLYYCGGDGFVNWLSYRHVFQYFKDYHPDSIIFFRNGPGETHLDHENIVNYHLLQQIAKECGVIVHDLSAIGSSAGSYAALHAASSLYDTFRIRLTNVCTLDAGAEWDSFALLTVSEMKSVAEAGTVFYLFEQPNIGLNVPAIRDMANHGINVWAVACSDSSHNGISANAYHYGVFSWSGGEDMSLPSSEYRFLHLTPEIGNSLPGLPSPFYLNGKDFPLLTAE